MTMAYSAKAAARRRCTGTRKDGAACRAWAVWDDPRQLCAPHAGRHHTGGIVSPRERWLKPEKPTMYEPCRCGAYDWPHRPGGGVCRWPEEPLYRLTTPAGTHEWPRVRRPKWWPPAKQRLSEARRIRAQERVQAGDGLQPGTKNRISANHESAGQRPARPDAG